MKIDMTLLRDLERRLNELGPHVLSQEYSIETIVQRFVQIEKGLKQANKTTKQHRENYTAELILWKNELEAENAKVNADHEKLLNHLRKANEFTVKLNKAFAQGKTLEIPQKLRVCPVDPETVMQNMSIFAAALTNVNHLLAQNAEFKLARKRRWLAHFSYTFFRFNRLITKILSITSIITIAYFAEILTEIWLNTWPKYFIALLIAIASGFTLDRQIDKITVRLFWRNGRKWLLSLAFQLKIPTENILAIQDFLMKKNNS